MRPYTVFRAFSRLLAALEGIKGELRDLSVGLSELCATQKEQGPAVDRLEALERSHHQFEAMCEGLLLKAEGKLRAANNAEARERQLRKSYAHLIDPLDEAGLEPEAPARNSVLDIDVEAREAERLHAMHLDAAPNNKALAQRAKFGVR